MFSAFKTEKPGGLAGFFMRLHLQKDELAKAKRFIALFDGLKANVYAPST